MLSTAEPRAAGALLLSTDVLGGAPPQRSLAGHLAAPSAPRFAAPPPPGLADEPAPGLVYRPGELFLVSTARPPRAGPPPLSARLPVSSACSSADTAELDAGSVGEAEEAAAEGPLGPRRQRLLLESALAGPEPALGSAALPTEGSRGHYLGICKPCAFVFKGGCSSGTVCGFCHLCPPEEKKLRKRLWKERRRAAGALRAVVGAATEA